MSLYDINGNKIDVPTNGVSKVDTLIGNLPFKVGEAGHYLLSSSAKIITATPNDYIDFNGSTEVYEITSTTYNDGGFEVLGDNLIKSYFARDTGKNCAIYFNPVVEANKKYTMIAKVVETDYTGTASIRIYPKGEQIAQLNLSSDYVCKTFESGKEGAFDNVYITMGTNGDRVVGTYANIEIHLYEGELAEMPTVESINLIANKQFYTDTLLGYTITGDSSVKVYKRAYATKGDGVIFFGDSIMDRSDIGNLFTKATGKSTLDCAVGGTRMTGSRDSSNEYYPYDMTQIADAIASGDFSTQISGGKNPCFSTLGVGSVANYGTIVLEFGTNDFTAKALFNGETDRTTIEGALHHIFDSILGKYSNMRIIVLSTLKYVTLGTGDESGVPTHTNGTVWKMNEVIKSVCEDDNYNIPFVDMYHLFGENGVTRNVLTSDGVHLMSPNGINRYLDILVGQLNALGI